MRGDTRCIEGRLYRHDPQHDDPDLETERGLCPDCNGAGCESTTARVAPTQVVCAEIYFERSRQTIVEGWSLEHDDAHMLGEMAKAAACYALNSTHYWPWDRKWWKPKERRRDLVRAAALIVAEIERLDRAARARG